MAVTDQQPRMTKDLLGQLFAQCHQEDRPVNGMETDDVLTDEVYISRPELLVVLVVVSVRVPAAEGDIVGQCVQPDVNNVLVVKGNRYAPVEGGTGNAQILQTGL